MDNSGIVVKLLLFQNNQCLNRIEIIRGMMNEDMKMSTTGNCAVQDKSDL